MFCTSEGNMSIQLIFNLVMSGIVALFVLSGMYWGFVRGLRRTAIRGVWLLVTAILLIILLSGMVTRAIANMQFVLTVDGNEFHNIEEIVSYYVENSGVDWSAVAESIDEVVRILMTYICLILNAFIFVILFWLLKIRKQ